MQVKKQKLLQQINVDDRPAGLSTIFQGVSIFVNGYTGADKGGE